MALKNKISGVYIILNKENGKFYVGSSIDVRKRIKGHKVDLEKNKHHSILLQRAYNKYGKDNFIFKLMEEIKAEELECREQYWLDFHQCYTTEIGYNISKNTSKPFLGLKRSEEYKIKKSLDYKNKWNNMSEEEKKNHPIIAMKRKKGYKISENHLEKIKSLVNSTINSEKGKATRKLMAAKVNYNNFRKPVLQYDLEGNFVKEWDSLKEANIALNKHIYSRGISNCCKGIQKHAYNFIWKFKKDI